MESANVNGDPAIRKAAPARSGVRRWPRLWAALGVLMLCAQLGLLAHQFGHHRAPDLAADNDTCALCQFAGDMASGPRPEALPPPALSTFRHAPLPATDRIAPAITVLSFRSRAPPRRHAVPQGIAI